MVGAAEVDPNKVFDAAERIVRDEEERAAYRDSWSQSPFSRAALGCATGVEAMRERADARTLPTLDDLKMTPVRAANLAAEERKPSSRSGASPPSRTP
jgi:hypothetical protein